MSDQDPVFAPLPVLTEAVDDYEIAEKRGKFSIYLSLGIVGAFVLALIIMAFFVRVPPGEPLRQTLRVAVALVCMGQIIPFAIGVTAFRRFSGWVGMIVSALAFAAFVVVLVFLITTKI